MKTRFLILVGLLLLGSLAGVALAQAASFELGWFTVDGGGGLSQGGAYAVEGTIGQPEAGSMAGGSYGLNGGFWGEVPAANAPQRLYLPLLKR